MLLEKRCPFSCRGNRITQLDWKRVPQARSRGCKSSVTITTECSRHSVVVRGYFEVFRKWRNDGVAAASSDGGPTGGRGPLTVLFYFKSEGRGPGLRK